MLSFFHPHKPPVLMFDYDGVIVDSLEVYYQEFTRLCDLLGHHHINSREAFLKLFDGNLVAQLIKAGFPLRKLKELARQLSPRIEEVNSRISPFPGMPQTLAELSSRYPLLIITANSSEAVRRFIRRYELYDIRAAIGSDTETSKVKKIRAARRLFPGHRPYYIGDTKGDMIEARRARATPIGVDWGWHSPARLRAGRAAHIASTQKELIDLISSYEEQRED